MHRPKFAAIVLAGVLVPALHAAPVLAAPPAKVWVSNAGGDSPTCGAVTSPCATFQQAHDNVAAGGEIGVLAPGDYAPLGVAKSVNVTNDGSGEASILAPFSVAGLGIAVRASRGDIISLRGLVIDGQGTGGAGIEIDTAAAVHIQNCVIRNFAISDGILSQPNDNLRILISDSIIFNNGAGEARSAGIYIGLSTSGNVNIVLDRVHLENNIRGLWVDGSNGNPNGSGVHAVIRDSVVSGNAGDGIIATTRPGWGPAFIVVARTSAVNNAGAGITADGPGATMLIDDNTVARNGVGLSAVNGGQLISYGNNRVNNNLGPDGSPTGNYGSL